MFGYLQSVNDIRMKQSISNQPLASNSGFTIRNPSANSDNCKSSTTMPWQQHSTNNKGYKIDTTMPWQQHPTNKEGYTVKMPTPVQPLNNADCAIKTSKFGAYVIKRSTPVKPIAANVICSKSTISVQPPTNDGCNSLTRSKQVQHSTNNVSFKIGKSSVPLHLIASNEEHMIKNSTPVQAFTQDKGYNNKSSTPIQLSKSNGSPLLVNLVRAPANSGCMIKRSGPVQNEIFKNKSISVHPPANDRGYKVKNSRPVHLSTNNDSFKVESSITFQSPANNGDYKIKNSTPVQASAQNAGYNNKSSTPFQLFKNNGCLNVKSSVPVQPAINKFKLSSNLTGSIPVHNVNKNSTEQDNIPDLYFDFDSPLDNSQSNALSPSSNSQNPLDISSMTTASHMKLGNIPDLCTMQTNNDSFKVESSITFQSSVNNEDYKIKNSTPVQASAQNGGYNNKSSTQIQLSKNNGCFNVKSSVPVQPAINKFKLSSNLTASIPVHNVNKNSTEQDNIPDLHFDSDSPSDNSQSNALSPISNSQNPLNISSTTTASPMKLVNIPDLSTMQLKENMFRCVKDHASPSLQILRLKNLFYSAENNSNSNPDRIGEKLITKKSHDSKLKNCAPDISSIHTNKVDLENHSVKSEKVETYSPLNKSAINNSKSERKVKEKSSKALKNFSPQKISKLCSKSSPAVKSTSKENPSIKSSTTGSPIKTFTKESPPVFNNQANPSSCDVPRVYPSHKDCDKKANKVLTNEATDSFICSKKERTSMYSGKKSLQEVPSLLTMCVQALGKNIYYIKFPVEVPYKQLKSVLQSCSSNQLRMIEENNPYLLTDTEEIWKSMCQRKYRDMKPTSNGTWRSLFWKTLEDRDKKLKLITANISAGMQKAAPERQIKLTHIKSPEWPSKRLKLSVPEPKPVCFKESSPSSSHHVNSFLESNAPSHKYAHKELPTSSSHPKLISKESNSSAHKKAKKVCVAPLMSKVKKTVGLLAMKKRYLGA